MGILERIKKLQEQGFTYEEAYDQVMEEEYWNERYRIEDDHDYRDGYLAQ